MPTNSLQYLGKHKLITSAFWKEFATDPHGRKGVSCKSKQETIAAIQRIGDIVLKPSPRARTATYNRKQYETYKKYLKGWNGYKLCFACRASAQCRHHLIWIKHGGRNHKTNIVALCNNCHAEIHPWLKDRKESNMLPRPVPNRPPSPGERYNQTHPPKRVPVHFKLWPKT